MIDNVYADDAAIVILKLMKESFGTKFKAYYEGDPVLIPRDSLPCIIVENIQTRVEQDATSTDKLSEQLQIKIVYDKMPDLGASDDFDTTERNLRRIVQGRDSVTGYFHPSTVLYVLRKNITLKGLALDSQIDVEYDVQPRPNQTVTSEAKVSIIVTERVIVPDRQ
jgi:hypothetical protein